MSKKQDALRRKLLGILPRATLDSLSELPRPWLANRADVISACLAKWGDGDAILFEVTKLIRQAK